MAKLGGRFRGKGLQIVRVLSNVTAKGTKAFEPGEVVCSFAVRQAKPPHAPHETRHLSHQSGLTRQPHQGEVRTYLDEFLMDPRVVDLPKVFRTLLCAASSEHPTQKVGGGVRRDLDGRGAAHRVSEKVRDLLASRVDLPWCWACATVCHEHRKGPRTIEGTRWSTPCGFPCTRNLPCPPRKPSSRK